MAIAGGVVNGRTFAGACEGAAIDWGSEAADQAPAAEPVLQVGAYITNISDIDLMEDQFSIELLL